MDKETKPGRPAGFFYGKGFYIALLLCALGVGSLAYLTARNGGNNVEEKTAVSTAEETPSYRAAMAETTPIPTEAPKVKTTPVPTQAPRTLTFLYPVEGEALRCLAMEALTYDNTMGDWRTHNGVDLTADDGSGVYASEAGTVTAVYEDAMLGTVVCIDHGQGMETVYANLQEAPTVTAGSAVMAGQIIGKVGNTALGESGEESHLHFAMRKDGKAVDPMEYLK